MIIILVCRVSNFFDSFKKADLGSRGFLAGLLISLKLKNIFGSLVSVIYKNF